MIVTPNERKTEAVVFVSISVLLRLAFYTSDKTGEFNVLCDSTYVFHICCIQTASVVSAELEETDSNASALTVGDPEPPRKQFCFKNATFEVILYCLCILICIIYSIVLLCTMKF